MFKSLFQWLVDKLAHFVFSALWALFVGIPFLVVKSLRYITDLISLKFLPMILYGKSTLTVSDLGTPITALYFLFLIPCLVSLIFIVIFVYAKASKHNNDESTFMVRNFWKNLPKFVLLTLLFPILIFVVVLLMLVFLQFLSSSINANIDFEEQLFSLIKPYGAKINDETWTNLMRENKDSLLPPAPDFDMYRTMNWGDGILTLILNFCILIMVIYVFAGMFTNTAKCLFNLIKNIVVFPIINTSTLLKDEIILKKWYSDTKGYFINLLVDYIVILLIPVFFYVINYSITTVVSASEIPSQLQGICTALGVIFLLYSFSEFLPTIFNNLAKIFGLDALLDSFGRNPVKAFATKTKAITAKATKAVKNNYVSSKNKKVENSPTRRTTTRVFSQNNTLAGATSERAIYSQSVGATRNISAIGNSNSQSLPINRYNGGKINELATKQITPTRNAQSQNNINPIKATELNNSSKTEQIKQKQTVATEQQKALIANQSIKIGEKVVEEFAAKTDNNQNNKNKHVNTTNKKQTEDKKDNAQEMKLDNSTKEKIASIDQSLKKLNKAIKSQKTKANNNKRKTTTKSKVKKPVIKKTNTTGTKRRGRPPKNPKSTQTNLKPAENLQKNINSKEKTNASTSQIIKNKA
ncbi:hypothetical protein [Mycoplasma phage sp.]|uniref:Transmembrane protein n=1 Tax=Mycoplasmopsis anatis 1340 TaxID=1034808 RepID=F9QDI1_9BACT|nr:hypothetical protein [Mycoplasmopsis anatis]QRI43890.1 hypothetical protein [Mycoplasma phage sp.]AWX70378.1 hypothetical protein DP067_03410 [Mycoplasmopsis anatis]EGS29197.1 hypothetical protein GIG_02443 [Mycoplasmopsis anatis 1340]QRI43941.1 hypothetical protein [Mycoplasma phage sp.]QRI43976.1 hypothetical protein [Mycoplasma phage sp.]